MSEPTTPQSAGIAPTVALPPTLEAETIPPPDVCRTEGTSAQVPAPSGYEIVRELGRGGMGVVYEARQTNLRRTVALKMILAGAHAGESELARFRTEAEAIARLQHPNIVQIHEVGEHGGLPYFALEYCAGGSLEKKLAGTPLSPREAAALVEPLARAMQAAHDKGVIHRDLKPANVLLASGGRKPPGDSSPGGLRPPLADCSPKITDFGLAKKLDEVGQTASGAVMGTPSYMAPEQAGYQPEAQARTIGPAADVYSLGAILYECLTGRPPFKAVTSLDTIMQVVSEEPAPPSLLSPQVPRDLETICLKCLQKEPAKRYSSAEALANDLHRFLAGEPIVARPVGRLERMWKWARRRPAAAALLVVSVIAGMALIGTVSVAAAIIYGKNRDLIDERDRANSEAEKARIAEGKAQERETEARQQAERAENTLIDGLLRPIGHNWDPELDPAEKQALEDVAKLEPHLRLRFVQRGLATPVIAERLSRRIGPIIDSAAGDDGELRSQLREMALAALHRGDADWHIQLAAAMLAEPLGETSPSFARDGAVASVVGLVQTSDEIGRTRYRNLLHVLTPHLDAAGFRDTARTAIDLIPHASAKVNDREPTIPRGPRTPIDPIPHISARAALTQEIADLAGKMDAEQGAAVCADAAEPLLQMMRQESAVLARIQLAQDIGVLAGHMKPSQATAVCSEAAAPLLQAIAHEPQASVRAQLGGTLATLSRHMDAAHAATLRKQVIPPLLQAIAQTVQTIAQGPDVPTRQHIPTLQHLTQILKSFVPQMDGATARETATALLQAISKKGAAFARTDMVWTMPDLAGRMDGTTAGQVACAGLDLIPTASDDGGRFELPQTIAKLIPAMDEAAARATAQRALELLSQQAIPPDAHLALAQVIADLTLSRNAGGTRADITVLLQVLRAETNGSARGYLANALASRAGRMDADTARTISSPLLQMLEKEPNGDARAALARAIVALAPRLDDAAAREAIAPFLQRLGKEDNASARYQFAQVLAALARHLDAAQARKVCAEASAAIFPSVAEGIKSPKVGFVGLAMTATALAPYMDSAAARQAAQPLLHALEKPDPSLFAHTELAAAILPLALQMDAAAAREVAERLLKMIPSEKVDMARFAIAQAIPALARQMDGAQGSAICTEAADSMLRALPKNPSAMTRFQTALCVSGLAHRMRPADAAKFRSQVAAMLLQPVSNDTLGFERFQIALGVASLAQHMDPTDGAKLCADAAAPLLQSLPKERDDARARLGEALAKLAVHMDASESARTAALTADALLDALNHHRGTDFLTLANAFATIAELTTPHDLAELLAKHRLPPEATELVLRRLEPLACRHFDNIDEAVRWFREDEPAPRQP